MSSRPDRAVDQAKLEAFLGKVVGDLGATLSIELALIGDKLGLYRAMKEAGPITSEELANKTGTSERYIREWLLHQAASGYVDYNSTTQQYALPPEQALALATEDSPFFVGGGFQVAAAMTRAQDRVLENFKTGKGMLWSEHHSDLFRGTERFFRASYIGHLVGDWIPSVPGLQEKLKAGTVVADVGCGHGASTVIMAQAFPNSKFFGFDNHEPSIERASQSARDAGLSDRVTFEVAGSGNFPNKKFDMIAFFDCLHDMGDPVSACKRARETLKQDGVVMLVEPMAGARLEDNFNPVGRVYTGASVLCCMPNALASGPIALGTVPTDEELGKVLAAGGFTRFRRATETPFNRVFEARP